jgi:tripartite-type tricarboxylate transporter receptor subunit TctC
MTMRSSLRLIRPLLLLLAMAPRPSLAQDEGAFYKGKTIRLIISVGVAGGFGEYARTLAEHLSRKIPGQPHIIVQSMPGAGGLLATNHLYNQAPQDGTTIGLVNATLPLMPLVGNKQARFDAMKFHYLGAMDRADGVCTIWHSAGIRTWDDMRTKEFTVGSIGAGSPMEVYALMFNRLFGAKIKVVGGYKAGSDIDLAMQREEIDGRCGTHLTTTKMLHPDWMIGPKFTVPVIVAEQRRPDYPDTPAIMEFVKDDLTRQKLELMMVPQKLNRPVLTPPNVPAERVKELREAFDATMKDPAFLAEIEKKGMQIDATGGEEVTNVLAKAYALPADVVAAARDMIGSN